mgnify:CR=1 FL=1
MTPCGPRQERFFFFVVLNCVGLLAAVASDNLFAVVVNVALAVVLFVGQGSRS